MCHTFDKKLLHNAIICDKIIKIKVKNEYLNVLLFARVVFGYINIINKIFDKDLEEQELNIKEDIGVVLDNTFFPELLNSKNIDSIMKKYVFIMVLFNLMQVAHYY